MQGFLLVIAEHPKPHRPKRDRDLSVASDISNSFNEQFNDPGLIEVDSLFCPAGTAPWYFDAPNKGGRWKIC
jgi:hypothetical protein